MEGNDGLTQVGFVQVGIDLCGGNGLVSQHLLDCTQISTALHQVSGKGVPKGMRTDRFLDAGDHDLRLGEVAAILPGFAVKARVEHEPGGRFQLIQGRHLTPGEPYSFKPADTLRITGARNAAVFAAQVVATERPEVGDALAHMRRQAALKVEASEREVHQLLAGDT